MGHAVANGLKTSSSMADCPMSLPWHPHNQKRHGPSHGPFADDSRLLCFSRPNCGPVSVGRFLCRRFHVQRNVCPTRLGIPSAKTALPIAFQRVRRKLAHISGFFGLPKFRFPWWQGAEPRRCTKGTVGFRPRPFARLDRSPLDVARRHIRVKTLLLCNVPVIATIPDPPGVARCSPITIRNQLFIDPRFDALVGLEISAVQPVDESMPRHIPTVVRLRVSLT